MKHIYNPEIFTRGRQYIVQWLERTDEKQWLRRRARVSDKAGARLLRMTVFEQLEWIAKRLPEPVEPEMPELDGEVNTRRMGHEG